MILMAYGSIKRDVSANEDWKLNSVYWVLYGTDIKMFSGKNVPSRLQGAEWHECDEEEIHDFVIKLFEAQSIEMSAAIDFKVRKLSPASLRGIPTL